VKFFCGTGRFRIRTEIIELVLEIFVVYSKCVRVYRIARFYITSLNEAETAKYELKSTFLFTANVLTWKLNTYSIKELNRCITPLFLEFLFTLLPVNK
jgi:hypothetical protein